jgi:HemY protein
VPAPEPLPAEKETVAEAVIVEPVRGETKEEVSPPPPEPVVFPTTPPDVPKPKEQASARRSVFSVW